VPTTFPSRRIQHSSEAWPKPLKNQQLLGIYIRRPFDLLEYGDPWL